MATLHFILRLPASFAAATLCQQYVYTREKKYRFRSSRGILPSFLGFRQMHTRGVTAVQGNLASQAL